MSIRRTSVPDWKEIETSKGMSRSTCLKCSTGSMKGVDLGELQQCRNGLIIPELFYLPAKKTETAGGCGADCQEEDPRTSLA